MGKPEGKIEDYLVARAKAARAEIRKVNWVGRRGAPDRFVLTDGANRPNFWVECKAPGKKLAEHQEREIERLVNAGEIVHVVDSRDEIDRILPLPRS